MKTIFKILHYAATACALALALLPGQVFAQCCEDTWIDCDDAREDETGLPFECYQGEVLISSKLNDLWQCGQDGVIVFIPEPVSLAAAAIVADTYCQTRPSERGFECIPNWDDYECTDSDGDGLWNGWEIHGVDTDVDGEVDLDLPSMGADPMHKDIFLEYDWAPGGEPLAESIQQVKDAFAAAPVDASGTPNPDGEYGINLWVDTGDLGIGDSFGGGGQLSGDFTCDEINLSQIRAENSDQNRNSLFHYAVGIPNGVCDFDNDGNTDFGGIANGILSLEVLLVRKDAPALMHELGHNLGLRHGGSDSNPCNPLLISVMSYLHTNGIRRLGSITPPPLLDFSPPRLEATIPGLRGNVLPTLDENNLDENLILDPFDPLNTMITLTGREDVFGGRAFPRIRWVNEHHDWNLDGMDPPYDVGVSTNIDYGDFRGCANNDVKAELSGFDEWAAMQFPVAYFLQQQLSGNSSSQALTLDEQCDLPNEMEALEFESALNPVDLKTIWAYGPSVLEANTVQNFELLVMVVNNDSPLSPSPVVNVTVDLPEYFEIESLPSECKLTYSGRVNCAVAGFGTIGEGDSYSMVFSGSLAPDAASEPSSPTSLNFYATAENLVRPDDITPADNSDTISVPVSMVADLTSLPRDDLALETKILIGEAIDLQLSVEHRNTGPAAPSNAQLNLSVINEPGLVISAAGAVPFQLPSANSWELQQFSVNATCVAGGNLTAQVEFESDWLTAYASDPNLTDNSGTLETEVKCVAPAHVTAKRRVHCNDESINLIVHSTDAGEYGLSVGIEASLLDIDTMRLGRRNDIWSSNFGVETFSEIVTIEDHKPWWTWFVGDGDLDMFAMFNIEALNIQSQDSELCLSGLQNTAGGQVPVFGCFDIEVRGGALCD